VDKLEISGDEQLKNEKVLEFGGDAETRMDKLQEGTFSFFNCSAPDISF
jgi:hypothetical protein